MKKWVLIGLALVISASVVAGIFYFTTTPGKIDRSQNKVVPVALNIMPAAQALQATLDVADMHGLTAGRVSQLRRDFLEDWQHFTADGASLPDKQGDAQGRRK